MTKLKKIAPVKTVSKIQSKGKRVTDPVRFPKVIDPIEKSVTDSYLTMMNSMAKMIQIELVNQTK